jgi:hypothetical protein
MWFECGECGHRLMTERPPAVCRECGVATPAFVWLGSSPGEEEPRSSWLRAGLEGRSFRLDWREHAA